MGGRASRRRGAGAPLDPYEKGKEGVLFLPRRLLRVTPLAFVG